jgi:hypothetical protein
MEYRKNIKLVLLAAMIGFVALFLISHSKPREVVTIDLGTGTWKTQDIIFGLVLTNELDRSFSNRYLLPSGEPKGTTVETVLVGNRAVKGHIYSEYLSILQTAVRFGPSSEPESDQELRNYGRLILERLREGKVEQAWALSSGYEPSNTSAVCNTRDFERQSRIAADIRIRQNSVSRPPSGCWPSIVAD